LACYQFGLAAAIELDDRTTIAATVANIAQTYIGLGMRTPARRLLAIAIQLVRGLNIPLFLAYMLADQARLDADDRQYNAAEASTIEMQAIATELDVAELILKAALLTIEVQVALQQIAIPTAIAACTALWEQSTEAGDRAAIALLLWQFTNADDYRTNAAAFYGSMYAQAPRAEYRMNYEHLTGERLPEAPPLPAPPSMIGQGWDLRALLARVEAIIPVVGPNDE
jgi:hypothetical protein